MLRVVLLLSLIAYLVVTVRSDSAYASNYRTNSSKPSKNLYSIIVDALESMGATCRSLKLCKPVNKLKTYNIYKPRLISSSRFPRRKHGTTAVEARGYFGGASPAYYPAIDPISILASLAFLAFLLQTFASLFARSRSVIPAVVRGRDSSPQYEEPDLVKLILDALYEYEILNNEVDTGDDKPPGKMK